MKSLTITTERVPGEKKNNNVLSNTYFKVSQATLKISFFSLCSKIINKNTLYTESIGQLYSLESVRLFKSYSCISFPIDKVEILLNSLKFSRYS